MSLNPNQKSAAQQSEQNIIKLSELELSSASTVAGHRPPQEVPPGKILQLTPEIPNLSTVTSPLSYKLPVSFVDAKIAIMDDEDLISEAAKALFTLGLGVKDVRTIDYGDKSTVPTFESAVENLVKNPPHILVTDVNFPDGRTSREVLDAVYKQLGAAFPPIVIVMSGLSENEKLFNGPYIISGFHPKPVKYSELTNMVKVSFEQKIAEQQKNAA